MLDNEIIMNINVALDVSSVARIEAYVYVSNKISEEKYNHICTQYIKPQQDSHLVPILPVDSFPVFVLIRRLLQQQWQPVHEPFLLLSSTGLLSLAQPLLLVHPSE